MMYGRRRKEWKEPRPSGLTTPNIAAFLGRDLIMKRPGLGNKDRIHSPEIKDDHVVLFEHDVEVLPAEITNDLLDISSNINNIKDQQPARNIVLETSSQSIPARNAPSVKVPSIAPEEFLHSFVRMNKSYVGSKTLGRRVFRKARSKLNDDANRRYLPRASRNYSSHSPAESISAGIAHSDSDDNVETYEEWVIREEQRKKKHAEAESLRIQDLNERYILGASSGNDGYDASNESSLYGNPSTLKDSLLLAFDEIDTTSAYQVQVESRLCLQHINLPTLTPLKKSLPNFEGDQMLSSDVPANQQQNSSVQSTRTQLTEQQKEILAEQQLKQLRAFMESSVPSKLD